MDGIPLWIEAMSDDELFGLNDVLNKYSIETGYYPGKTEEPWWATFVHIINECRLRNRARGW